ncbi:MAG TPA: TIM-barrel domain-containing protein, partial [Rhodanobacteraceae bacterium]|nr:TIM-barrel domain-containing protein [Rhodanobacteraceae bacterium]
LFGELANLSGHAPLFPKWSLGFINSQWDIDEKAFRQVIATYRAKHIPLDAFTFDFDWKAWGEDWGEFRWNAKKFPDGPTGKLKADMDKLGVHMTGIMKPRVHIDTVEGRYATAHDLWLPGEKASPDYFSHQPVKDIDFDKPAARAWWFNDALKHSFDTGIVGWWNDEADTTQSNTQFLNMQRATWDGQRAHSKLRVWSINRNFWLGAQRYAYGLWSGDIDTGFKSMAAQRARMLSAIDVGEMQWGMDGGGFNGHPTPENYARWIEFGAFTPIFRVHGTFGEKRQPWVYGAVAEKAATAAIRLRYALLPYIYAYERHDHVAGVGLVRPLAFAWPHDAQVRNDVDAWMFGDWLLVSPVVEQGQAAKDIYLPAGTWTDWSSGAVHAGGQRIHYTTDRTGWSDIPLFVRQGAIIPTQPVLDHVGQKPVAMVDVDVFPATARTHFDYYDDDGETYAYMHGGYFQQRLSTQRLGDRVEFAAGAPVGSWTPALRYYLVKIHGGAARAVQADGAALPKRADEAALRATAAQGWATGHDRFGAVTWIKLAAGKAVTVDAGMPAWHDHLLWQGRTAGMQAGGDGGFVLHTGAGDVRRIAPQPLATHTASVLFDGLFAMAQDDLRRDSVDAIRDDAFDHGQAMPCHCFETGAKWHYVWTRDLSYAVDLGLWRFDPSRSRNGLEFKLSGVRAEGVPQGLYPMQDTGSGGSWPISTDRVVWFLGARHLLDDAAFADRV